MQQFKSIVIQPRGDYLGRSCELDHPVFVLREMPVKEHYMQALKKINEVLHPETADKKQKPEQSVANMMLSNKGTSLDLHRQMTKLGLNAKACRNIPSSKSTLFEKLEIDKKNLVSSEERATFNLLLLIKQKLECDLVQSGQLTLKATEFQDLSKIKQELPTYFGKEGEENFGELKRLVDLPMSRREPTYFEKLANKSKEVLQMETEINFIQKLLDYWHGLQIEKKINEEEEAKKLRDRILQFAKKKQRVTSTKD